LKKKNTAYFILAALALICIVGVLLMPPIPQDPDYHHFSDANTILNIPNFWNVVSNLPFLVIGVLGMIKLSSIVENRTSYFIFFLGITMVSIGSAYYHLDPNNHTLVWDRLPMTVAFMALLSILVGEFINLRLGRVMLVPALIIGGLSILNWVLFDDLRFYGLVQFYPMLAIPIILIFFRSRYDLIGGYWLLLLAYIIAKVLEHFDHQTYDALQYISGHTLKHLFAAMGLSILLYTYLKRKKHLV